MYIKELSLYMDYLQDKLDAALHVMDKKQQRYFGKFIKNMERGIEYYQNLFTTTKDKFVNKRALILSELENNLNELKAMKAKIESVLVS